MTLTRKNMKVDPTGNLWDFGALVEDITVRMDADQLNRYVRSTFTGTYDIEYLPEHSYFWRAYSLNSREGHAHEKPGPDRLFASIYSVIDEVAQGDYELGSTADPEFKPRLEKVLRGILKEAIDHTQEPSAEQKMLARFAIGTVESICFNDRYGIFKIDDLIKLSGQVQSLSYMQQK